MFKSNRNLTYIGMARTKRGWKHISFDHDKQVIVPTPSDLIPPPPEKKSP